MSTQIRSRVKCSLLNPYTEALEVIICDSFECIRGDLGERLSW